MLGNPWKSMKIYENLWKSMKIHDNQQKTMKILRWQEASLESSKGFYMGSRLSLTVLKIHARKSMKIYENLWKSMKIHENPWKSMKIYENLWKSMKIYENLWKSEKIYENLCKSMALWGSCGLINSKYTFFQRFFKFQEARSILSERKARREEASGGW